MVAYIQVPSPNFGYPRGAHGQNTPEAIVWHITASAPTATPLAGLDSWFTNPAAGAAHLGIQDDVVHQYVQFADAPWHAGIVQSPDLANANVARWSNGNINPNLRTIGIEVVSLPGVGDVPKGLQRLNPATWQTMLEVGADIVQRFPSIKLSAVDWLGHYQIDGITRTRDPKTIYWPTDILRAILGEEDDDMAFIGVGCDKATIGTNQFESFRLYVTGLGLFRERIPTSAQREALAAAGYPLLQLTRTQLAQYKK